MEHYADSYLRQFLLLQICDISKETNWTFLIISQWILIDFEKRLKSFMLITSLVNFFLW